VSVAERRIDPFLGTVVHVVTSRQSRPNLPSTGCPFCVGGLEAPEPYDVKAFPNRWPALGEGMCEVVLYTSRHDATFATLGVPGARKVVDLWADRTAALRHIPGVEFVLVFENRGREVGATIDHPHGQVYAYDHVPSRPRRRLEAEWRPDGDPGDRLVMDLGGWTASTQGVPVHPVSISVAPKHRLDDLPSAGDADRTELAALLVDLMGRLDRLHSRPLPYMMWLYQTPSPWPGPAPWFNIEIVSPWRAAGVPRHIAAAELACEEYFNPVDPVDIAARLRALA
jgi:UDPglucose--hexose-1-phosphate uridylyltransferase